MIFIATCNCLTLAKTDSVTDFDNNSQTNILESASDEVEVRTGD